LVGHYKYSSIYSYLTLNNIVTLKSRLGVTQGIRKWRHSKACVLVFIFAFHSNDDLHHFGDKARIAIYRNSLSLVIVISVR